MKEGACTNRASWLFSTPLVPRCHHFPSNIHAVLESGLSGRSRLKGLSKGVGEEERGGGRASLQEKC